MSDETRDWVAEGLGGLFSWIPDAVSVHPAATGFGLAVLTGTFALWRISLRLFPYKRCSRCKGAASWGPGKLRRPCGSCVDGRRPRVGSGR